MCKNKGAKKTGNSDGGTEKRGGYTPEKDVKGGYTPSGPEKSELPEPPSGGSGEKDE